MKKTLAVLVEQMRRDERRKMIEGETLAVLVELRREIEIEICYRMKALDAERLEMTERG